MLSLPSRPDSFGTNLEAVSVRSQEAGDKDSPWEDEETAWAEGRVTVATASAIEVAVDVDVDISSTDLDPGEDADEIKTGQAALKPLFRSPSL